MSATQDDGPARPRERKILHQLTAMASAGHGHQAMKESKISKEEEQADGAPAPPRPAADEDVTTTAPPKGKKGATQAAAASVSSGRVKKGKEDEAAKEGKKPKPSPDEPGLEYGENAADIAGYHTAHAFQEPVDRDDEDAEKKLHEALSEAGELQRLKRLLLQR
eukprot:4030217-Pyramimonas_sp.AAC.1